MKLAKLGGSKRSPMGNSSLSEVEEMPELTPREDYNKLTIKRFKEIVKERGNGEMGHSKLKMQELINLMERGSNLKKN